MEGLAENWHKRPRDWNLKKELLGENIGEELHDIELTLILRYANKNTGNTK